jgi:hypothetical protein
MGYGFDADLLGDGYLLSRLPQLSDAGRAQLGITR